MIPTNEKSETLNFFNKVYQWVIENGKNDPTLRIVLGGLVWVLIIYLGQFIAYRQIQVFLFEVPPDRIVNHTNTFEVLQSLRLFPYYLILAPLLIMFFLPLIRALENKALEYAKTKGKGFFSVPLRALEIFIICVIIYFYSLIYNSSLYYSAFLFAAILLFLTSAYFLNQNFIKMSANEANKNKELGLMFLNLILFFVLSSASIICIGYAQQGEEQSKKLTYDICKNITFVAVNTGVRHHPGWLISRDASTILVRELKNDVYQTVEFKSNDVKEFIYMKRFGADEEKNRAFPACFDTI